MVTGRIITPLVALVVGACAASAGTQPAAMAPPGAELYRSDAFVLTDSSVRQGRFEAVALSRDSIVSTYPRAAREVHFKFSINSQENEFPPGTDYTLYLRPREGRIETPLYTFGEELPPDPPTPEESAGGEEGTAQVTFRLDMRHVLRSFAERDVYDPPAGPPIGAGEFEAVYVIGNTEPLTWDFASLRPGSPLELTDADGDSIYTVTLPFEARYTRPVDAAGRALWARTLDLSGFPQLASEQRLPDALYRLSLEELRQLAREDGTLMTGAKWPAVWTRDLSYASVLALALVAPDAVRRSLLVKVDSAGRIIQDTGTGGSWPVSTDRMVWALAAWELYAATGDREWLRSAYDVIRSSVEADLATAFDEQTGLFRGESSFLDWREQSHPRWMDAKDIYLSRALGTNGVHHATYRVLAEMARALGEPAERWDGVAERVRQGIETHLWEPRRGWYGQYLYGRNSQALSPRADALGEALAVLHGVCDPERCRELVRSAPVVAFGAPSFWAYIPGRPPYHNAAIWPFVTAYWTWAAADAGNTAAVEHGLASLSRAAALFLTNKENLVAETGHFEGTELNSDRQLWSVAGTLAATYRVLLGMRLHPDRLEFRPMVPPGYAGERTLKGLRYRGAVLNVTVRGFGDAPASAVLDGRPVERAEVQAGLEGEHTVEIEMNGRWPGSGINLVENRYAPPAPRAVLRGETLAWGAVDGAARYAVYRNGRRLAAEVADTQLVLRPEDGMAEYQVLAVDGAGLESFLSEPARLGADGAVVIVQPPAAVLRREHEGYTGAGYVPLTRERNTTLEIPVRVSHAGVYGIDVRYANGSGPINSGDRAAIRTLRVDEERVGALVMPHRGTDLWTDWGYSNPLHVELAAGEHTLTLELTATDENMNGAINTALLDHVRLTRLSEAP